MELGSLTRLQRIRLGVALIGVVVWFNAVKFDDERIRVVGMVLLGAALLMRFVPKRFTGDERDLDDEEESN